MIRRRALALITAVASGAAAATASAYSDPTTFSRDPSSDTAGGGGGFYFTGSPRQHGLDCAACHIEGPDGTALRLSALLDGQEATLFDRGYEPGRVYEIEVAFDGDRLRPEGECSIDQPCDLNLFALEIVDEGGHPAGGLCPVRPGEVPGAERCGGCRVRRGSGTLVEDECSVVLADGFDDTAMGFRNGATAFSFFWRAPSDDVGPLLLHVSGVDGRGPETPGGEVTSYLHDGVVTLRLPLHSPTRMFSEASGCACRAAPAPRFGALPWVLVALAVWCRRRAARR
ncbi:MAG: hypothetical protein IT384_04450 [Deltaproteobacteria bacterium]|nr:hypothetical protein [Deltaproteobacteria bacterium]